MRSAGAGSESRRRSSGESTSICQAAPGTEVADRDPGHLAPASAAACCRGRQVFAADRRGHRRPRAIAMMSARVAVVGERARFIGRGGHDERPQVGRRRQWGGDPAPSTTRPAGASSSTRRPEACAEWGIVGRLAAGDHDLVPRRGREERVAMMLGQRRARVVEAALERTRVGGEQRGEDKDGHGAADRARV